MSVSLNANVTDRIALSGTPGLVTEVILDKKVRSVEVTGYDAAGTARGECKVALAGTDAAAIGADFQTVLADAPGLKLRVAGRARNLAGTSVFIASGVASVIVEVRTSSN